MPIKIKRDEIPNRLSLWSQSQSLTPREDHVVRVDGWQLYEMDTKHVVRYFKGGTGEDLWLYPHHR